MTEKEDMIQQLREQGLIHQSDLEQVISKLKTPEQQVKAQDFLDHLLNCEDDDCKVHQVKSDIETENFMLGFLSRDLVG